MPTPPAAPTPSLPAPVGPTDTEQVAAALGGLTSGAVPGGTSADVQGGVSAPTSLYSRPNGVQGNLVSSGPQPNSMWETSPDERAALQAKQAYWNTPSVLEGLRAAQAKPKSVFTGPPRPYDPTDPNNQVI